MRGTAPSAGLQGTGLAFFSSQNSSLVSTLRKTTIQLSGKLQHPQRPLPLLFLKMPFCLNSENRKIHDHFCLFVCLSKSHFSPWLGNLYKELKDPPPLPVHALTSLFSSFFHYVQVLFLKGKSIKHPEGKIANILMPSEWETDFLKGTQKVLTLKERTNKY